MPVPTYDQFVEPVMRYLAQHPQGAGAQIFRDILAGIELSMKCLRFHK
ncbi:MAG: hypothetical protein WCF48_10070 [Terriglobales bacterium]